MLKRVCLCALYDNLARYVHRFEVYHWIENVNDLFLPLQLAMWNVKCVQLWTMHSFRTLFVQHVYLYFHAYTLCVVCGTFVETTIEIILQSSSISMHFFLISFTALFPHHKSSTVSVICLQTLFDICCNNYSFSVSNTKSPQHFSLRTRTTPIKQSTQFEALQQIIFFKQFIVTVLTLQAVCLSV